MNRIFRCFRIIQVSIGPAHQLSSCFDFGFEFVEIFVITPSFHQQGFRSGLPAEAGERCRQITSTVYQNIQDIAEKAVQQRNNITVDLNVSSEKLTSEIHELSQTQFSDLKLQFRQLEASSLKGQQPVRFFSYFILFRVTNKKCRDLFYLDGH